MATLKRLEESTGDVPCYLGLSLRNRPLLDQGGAPSFPRGKGNRGHHRDYGEAVTLAVPLEELSR